LISFLWNRFRICKNEYNIKSLICLFYSLFSYEKIFYLSVIAISSWIKMVHSQEVYYGSSSTKLDLSISSWLFYVHVNDKEKKDKDWRLTFGWREVIYIWMWLTSCGLEYKNCFSWSDRENSRITILLPNSTSGMLSRQQYFRVITYYIFLTLFWSFAWL
jgi:hypothetical protein